MHSFNQAIALLEKEVLTNVSGTDDYQLLLSIPGVGEILGQTILLETGTIKRFPNAGNYASYARCVKSEKISNGKRKGSGNSKNGNKYLAWAFIEAAHFATIWDPQIKRYYQRKLSKAYIMVAKKAVANKLAKACFHMLNNQMPFDVHKSFG